MAAIDTCSRCGHEIHAFFTTRKVIDGKLYCNACYYKATGKTNVVPLDAPSPPPDVIYDSPPTIIRILRAKVGKATIELVQGDITEQDTDVIVNSANSRLLGGAGVDGAIHWRGGPAILEECRRIRLSIWPDGLPTGQAVITTGGNLKAKFVIHTVGPVWHGGHDGEPELLADCYRNSLALAKSKGLMTIAFPSIGTRTFGYPIELAGQIALRTVKEFLEKEDGFDEVVFVLYTQKDLEVYYRAASTILA